MTKPKRAIFIAIAISSLSTMILTLAVICSLTKSSTGTASVKKAKNFSFWTLSPHTYTNDADSNIDNARAVVSNQPFHVASLSRSGMYTIVIFSMNGCPPCDDVWRETKSMIKDSKLICAVKVNISPILQRMQAGSGDHSIEDEIFCNAIWHSESEMGFPSMIVYNPVGGMITDIEIDNRTHLIKSDGLFSGTTECIEMVKAIRYRSGHIPHVLNLIAGTQYISQELNSHSFHHEATAYHKAVAVTH